jgi:hypothetical protein
MSELEQQLNVDDNVANYIFVSKDIPQSLVNEELEDAGAYNQRMVQIKKYYDIYRNGAKFNIEGTNGDYQGANLKFKKAARLINKEARFLFGKTPDLLVNPRGDIVNVTDSVKQMVSAYQEYIKTVCSKNNIGKQLVLAAKDCFIGGLVGAYLNFNEQTGVRLTFLNATQFVFETKTDNSDELSKFVAFTIVNDSMQQNKKRIFKKKYELKQVSGKNVCYVSEALYDGTGTMIEELMAETKTEFERIPAVVICNDGLLDDLYGESEIAQLVDSESWYNKLSSSDIDASRKNMNAIRYAIDMDSNSTANLSTAPGAFWDLQTDQNLDKANPQVGTLETQMSYSGPLQSTLERIDNEMYDMLDIPNINIESMRGTITSGKALKALYWSLVVRCEEKLKTWAPKLRYLISCMIDGALAYPNCVKNYTDETLTPINYEIEVDPNYPLPEDENEEKQMDMVEVQGGTMSHKAYMKKWRELTDAEADEELTQIASEKVGDMHNFDVM